VPATEGSSAVVVLGAGRSGTSAITRALPAIGVALGENLRRGRGKNPTGFFEDRDLLALNKRLKRALGIRGDSVRLIEADEWQTPAVRRIHDQAVATIARRFGGQRYWGYKYGRTLRMLPFWQEVYQDLGLDVRYVVALRNPMSVARSREALDSRRGTQEKSDLEWLVNVVPYLRAIRDRPFVVVDYDLLMANPGAQLERMAKKLGIALADRRGIEEYTQNFLKPGMRHSRFTTDDLERDERIHPLVRQAYTWLYRLAADQRPQDDPRAWDDWARIEREVAALAPALRHIDAVQRDLRRAQWSPLGPLQGLPEVWRRLRAR